MKKICRILSIASLVVIGVITIVLIVLAIRKPRDEDIYATSINFKTMAEAVEIYGENSIALSRDIVNIKPADCTLEPEFLFKKYGQSGETKIDNNVFKFEETGKYILICRVKSGEDYYIEDRLTIDVVNEPRETTSFYITDKGIINLYIDESVSLEHIVPIKRSNDSIITLIHDEHISYQNSTITPLKEGVSEMTVVLKDNDFAICQKFLINVKPSVINAEVKLVLTVGENVLNDNVVEREYSIYNFDVGYTLENLDRDQSIECWTDGDVVEVVKYNSPLIRLRPLKTGTTFVYVKPLERPDLTFKIIVSII